MTATSFHQWLGPEVQGGDHAADETSRDGVFASQLVRRLARKLTPVVVDLGVGQPRFASYLDWDEAGQTVRLAPVAGAILRNALRVSEKNVRIRSQDPGEPWMLVVRNMRVEGDRVASLELRGTTARRLDDRQVGRTRVAVREPLVLAVHDGEGSLDGHVFPIVGLGSSHCLIDSTAPLSCGQALGSVEVIRELRIIRRATARVIEVIPWITAHGDHRFWCRLMLDELLALPREAASAENDGHDLLSDPGKIERLLDLASMVELQGWYDAPGWPRAAMRIGELHHHLCRLKVAGLPPPDAIPLPAQIRIGFELFAVSYEAQVRLHRRRGSRLEVVLPFLMRRRRRRRERRALVASDRPVTVTFRSSATGQLVHRRVRDVSHGGLCFEADPALDVLWNGVVLDDARIKWAGGDATLGDLEVRALEEARNGEWLCHTANRKGALRDSPDLIELLAELYHPEAHRHDGGNFSVMVDFYRRAGLLGEFMERNLREVWSEAAVSWRKLHQERGRVACTLVFRDGEGQPQATFSGVRVWEKTWLAQHFGALPTADRRATGTLQLAYLDFVTPQPDTHYMAFFVKAGNALMNAFHEKFFGLTGTPESINRVTVTLWTLRAGTKRIQGDAPRGYGMRPLRRRDEVVASRAAERVFGPMTSHALSLVPKGFCLPQTARRFEELGLERGRQCFAIDDAHGVAAALMKERTSPGVNLTWMLDAWWFLPISSYGTAEIDAVTMAAHHITAAPQERPQGDKFLIVPDGTPSGPLVEAGFEKLLDAHLYILNRSGLRRYYEYIADRYGELGVRVTKREARMARSAS
ncbi:MAG: hypothetical protein ABIS92_17490 [Polyangia bacterium]